MAFNWCATEKQLPLRLTEEGERVESHLSDLQKRLKDSALLSFLMWGDTSSQLYVHFETLSGNIQCQNFDFSALWSRPAIDNFWQAMFVILRHAQEQNQAIAMIVDAHGHTEGFDWSTFLLGQNIAIPSVLPDYLVLSAEAKTLLKGSTSDFRQDDMGFWIYERHDQWRTAAQSTPPLPA